MDSSLFLGASVIGHGLQKAAYSLLIKFGNSPVLLDDHILNLRKRSDIKRCAYSIEDVQDVKIQQPANLAQVQSRRIARPCFVIRLCSLCYTSGLRNLVLSQPVTQPFLSQARPNFFRRMQIYSSIGIYKCTSVHHSAFHTT